MEQIHILKSIIRNNLNLKLNSVSFILYLTNIANISVQIAGNQFPRYFLDFFFFYIAINMTGSSMAWLSFMQSVQFCTYKICCIKGGLLENHI